MKVKVFYQDKRVVVYADVHEAQRGVLNTHQEGVYPKYVQQINDDGTPTGRYFGWGWSVLLSLNAPVIPVPDVDTW